MVLSVLQNSEKQEIEFAFSDDKKRGTYCSVIVARCKGMATQTDVTGTLA